jgi:hypothetical protein
MQLRAARLCLDCEELHVEETCPRCASPRYAFLSIWLPSEERRRWRRPTPAVQETGPIGAVRRVVAKWFGISQPGEQPAGRRSRASDFVPNLGFDQQPREQSPTPPAPLDPEPAPIRNGQL